MGLNPGQGLSTTLPVGIPVTTPSSVLVRASNTRKPVAGGKAISKPRQRTQGEWGVVDNLGIGVDVFIPAQYVEQDAFVIKIPNSKEEYFIPGKFVRENSIAIREVTQSYANLLNVSADELRMVKLDLTAQFATIRLEFSEAHFPKIPKDINPKRWITTKIYADKTIHMTKLFLNCIFNTL